MSALLTIREAQDRLGGASRATVYRHISAGSFAVVDIRPPGSKRSKIRVDADSLDTFIKRRTHAARRGGRTAA
jgi:hypothetical protein